MREGGSCFFTESLLYNGELFYVLALKLFIYCYLVLSSFHAVVCVSHLLCFSFPFPCSPFGAFQFARHGDKISEKKEQNVRMEEKKQKKNACFVCRHHGCFGLGGVARMCFFTRRFQEQERIMQYSFIPLQPVLFRITLRGEVILKSNVKLPSVLCISDKSLMDRPGCFI